MSTKIHQQFSQKRAAASAAAVLALAGLCAQASAGGGSGFNYPNFSSTAGLALNGHAVQTSNVIDLNGPTVAGARAGSVWHTSQQNVQMGFVSNFSFRITDVNGNGGGGFTFSIHNSTSGPSGTASFGTSALGPAGGALGYGSNVAAGGTNPGINNSLTLEFDTYTLALPGLEPLDYMGDHMSLHRWTDAGLMPLASNSMAHALPAPGSAWTNISDGGVYDVRIQYVPGNFQVYIKRSTDAVFGLPAMSEALDLSSLIPLSAGSEGVGQAWVGFTGATGGIQDFERHQILSWDFSGNNIPSPGALALLGLGGAFAARRRSR